MKNSTTNYSKPKQAILPIFISDYLDICDPVLVFDRFMEEIDLEKYLNQIPAHVAGRIRYNPTSMLKTVLFEFMTYGLSHCASWRTTARSTCVSCISWNTKHHLTVPLAILSTKY